MSEMSEYVPHRLGDSDEDVRRNVRTHTRQEWIFEKIRQELSPVACKLTYIVQPTNNGSSPTDLHDLNRHQIE